MCVSMGDGYGRYCSQPNLANPLTRPSGRRLVVGNLTFNSLVRPSVTSVVYTLSPHKPSVTSLLVK